MSIITLGFGPDEGGGVLIVREICVSIIGLVSLSSRIIGYVSDSEDSGDMGLRANRISTRLGDDRTISVTTVTEDTEEAVDLTGAKLWFTVKESTRDPDSSSIMLKRNTEAGGDDTQIKVTDAATGTFDIYITPADFEGVEAGSYVYDIQVKLFNNKLYTIVSNRIEFIEDITEYE